MTGVMAAAAPTTTERVDVTTSPPGAVTASVTENVALVLNRCVVMRSAEEVPSPKFQAYVQVSKHGTPLSVVAVASNVTRSNCPGFDGVHANESAGMLGPDKAMRTVCAPDVTMPSSLIGVAEILADVADEFAAGAVNCTVTPPFPSVVTSVALSVPAVVANVSRCPGTTLSEKSRTASRTSETDC